MDLGIFVRGVILERKQAILLMEMSANDSFFKDLSNKPSLGALVHKLGELRFQHTHLVIFSTTRLGFSQNLLKGFKFCLKNIVWIPLIFLGKLSILLLDRTSSNGIEQSMSPELTYDMQPQTAAWVH